jgi:iron complex transport system substrate-binding protein
MSGKSTILAAVVRRVRALALSLALLSLLPATLAATQQSPSASASPASTLAVTDEAGRAIRVPQPVRRIVSLAPNLTETVFALGQGDLLVGDTDYCTYPPEALKKTHVGGPVNPSLEEVMALHPDLVLATPTINRLVTVQALERLGVAVYVADPRTVDQILSSTERLGSLLGASEQASTIVAALRDRLDQLRERLSGSQPRSVFFVTWVDPLISVGGNTFLADALRLAGAHSVIASPQDWPTVSLEQVVHSQPEYLIFSSDDPGQVQHQVAELRSRPGWQGLEALRQSRIIILSEAFSRPAPRLIDSIEQLARALHPDRFPSGRLLTPQSSGARSAAIFSQATGAL